MVQKEVRNYEISVWTLQDDFITVLKAADIQRKGQTQDGEMTLNVDGTQELSFSIPMYLYEGATRIENPAWYNYAQGILISSMRKIKLILNKGTEYEDIFEFLITKVTEKHEKGELMCEVQCEGLAFHELGKTGYKVSLSSDDFYAEDLEWFVNYEKERGTVEHPDEVELIKEFNKDTFYINLNNKKVKNTSDLEITASDGTEITEKIINMGDDGYISTITNISLTEEQSRIVSIVYQHDDLAQPHATLQYWLNKFMKPYPTNSNFIDASTWYYSIEMDWSSYTNFTNNSLIPRDSHKVYEDEYVASWQFENDMLLPKKVEGYKEKERMLDKEESNKYNLTQDLAEAFGIYCKYVYEHDKNYRITARRVIFYNNFIEEEKGPIDINYKYHSSSISREMDSTELVTKMYIKAVDDDVSENGIITIMDVDANKSKEDYILNFDYVHAIGAINDDAYDEINDYEAKLREKNENIILLQNKIISLEAKLPEEEAKLTTYQNAIALDQENYDDSLRFLNNITNGTGEKAYTENDPRMIPLILDDNGTYHLNLSDKGIDVNSVNIYKTYNRQASTGNKLTNPITGKFEYDEFNNLNKVKNLYSDSTIVYVTYTYCLKTYYDTVKKVWEIRLANDKIARKNQQEIVDKLKSELEANRNALKPLLAEKQAIIEDFELLMGPALREGYWQPEEYTDYGDEYIDSFILNLNSAAVINGSTSLASFIWDEVPFEGEQELTYQVGAQQNSENYVAINIEELLSKANINWDDLAFLYYNSSPQSVQYRQSLVAGSQAQFVFLKHKNENRIYPALLLTGVKNLSDDERDLIEALDNSVLDAAIGTLSATVEGEQIKINEEHYISVNDLIETDEYNIVYPRIKINSLAIKNSEDQLILTYNGEKLENYTDYSVLTRVGEADESVEGYYITLDPKTILEKWYGGNKKINILYTLSNANTAIYLDALEVLKDSSQPQVSYTVDVAAVQKEYIQNIHRMLNRIVHINDYELKFENVQGYVSEVTLNLDRPWEDSIEIKNYKTKFEDLFTKIVASTEAMQKQSYVAGIVSQAFSSDGNLQLSSLQQALNSAPINYRVSDTIFTIDAAHGITLQNDEGILAFRDGGLFGATKRKTDYSKSGGTIITDTSWDWKTFITPSGINMKNVMIGQLDTNNISIFSGDNKKFQLNAEGLFAYKQTDNNNSVNGSPYVVLNSEGLFHNENGVDRVEVSWNGFKLRNKAEDEVFYANPDTGNLIISGTIYATNGKFTGIVEATSGKIGNWEIGNNGIIYTDNNNAIAGFIPLATSSTSSALWIGGTSNSASFRVEGNGILHASGASITGNTSINTTGAITITGSGSTILINTSGIELTNSNNDITMNAGGISLTGSNSGISMSAGTFSASSSSGDTKNQIKMDTHGIILSSSYSTVDEAESGSIIEGSGNIIDLDAQFLTIRGISGELNGKRVRFCCGHEKPRDIKKYGDREISGTLWIDTQTNNTTGSGWTICNVYYIKAPTT